MEATRLRAYIGDDGLLKIELPTNLNNTDVELVLVYQPTSSGWSENYFEDTYGSLADDPLERPPQGDFEERDELL